VHILSHGDAIGGWTLEAPVGQGGFATVWRARSGSGRVGALKVLQEAESSFATARSRDRLKEQRARLRREARALAELEHPNVVGLIEVVDGERLAMITEFVDGPNLAEWMLSGPYEAPLLTAVFAGILDGVEAAHAGGWVHRDLKPANILLEPTVPPRARVADFGLAIFADTTRLTRSGSMLGTPSYMAPEQVREPSQVDPRADLFALGAILFEMWCNRPAFMVGDIGGTLQASSAGLYPNPRLLRPDLPEAVATAIVGALEPDQNARIPDCATLRSVLEGTTTWELRTHANAATTMASLVEPPAPPSPSPGRSRGWMGLGLGGAVVVAAAFLAGVSPRGASEPAGIEAWTPPADGADQVEQLLLQVNGLLAGGRWDDALALADRAVELAPERASALQARARARAGLGDLASARVDFEAAQAKASGQDRLRVLLEQAEVELGLGQVARPLALLGDASESAEQDGRWEDVVHVQTLLGWAAWYLRDAEQLEQSQAVLRRAMETLAPDRPERGVLRAHAAYLGGLAGVVRDDAEAIATSRRALASGSVTHFADLDVATAVKVLGAYERALAGDQEGLVEIALEWDFCEAQANGGEALQRLGLHEPAARRLRQAQASCGMLGAERLFRFVAEQGLARDAARRGEAEAEARHRAEMRRLWPTVERPHPRVAAAKSP